MRARAGRPPGGVVAHFASAETLFALAILVWAGIGLFAANRGVLYEVRFVIGTATANGSAAAPADGAKVAEVVGRQRQEGGFARAAFLMAALLAGYRIAVAGRLPGPLCALCGLAALGAAGHLLWDLRSAGQTIVETLDLAGLAPGAGGGPTLAIRLGRGFYVLSVAGALVFASGVGAWIVSRRRLPPRA